MSVFSRNALRFTACLLALALATCQPVSRQQLDIGSVSRNEAERIRQLLYLAATEPPPFTYRYRLQAAVLMKQGGEPALARQVLEDMDTSQLNDDEFAVFTIQQAELLLKEKKSRTRAAIDILYDTRLVPLLPGLSSQQRASIHLLRIRAQILNNQPLLAFGESVRADTLLTGSPRQANRMATWEILMNTPRDSLLRHLANTSISRSPTELGWLELALLCRDYEAGGQELAANFASWQRSWGSHPALEIKPPAVRLLLAGRQAPPKQLTLLLPLSGPLGDAGSAVRDGFLAAWYAARAKGEAVPVVNIMDVGGETDVVFAYGEAVEAGADLVVGPLDRDKVQQLLQVDRMPVPVLALNRGNRRLASEQLYQFGLHPDDELEQLVNAADQYRWQNALLLRPASDWSEKMAERFAKLWAERNGVIVAEGVYMGERDISRVVEQTLLLHWSKRRQRTMETRIQVEVEAEPRRRQDVDVVVLLAPSDAARLLKPVLEFHRADDLPVIGISRVYDGSDDAGQNADLGGIFFTDMPWLLEESALRRAAEQLEQPGFVRMHALGADVWRLLPWLEPLRKTKNSRLYGATGQLSINSRGLVQRHLHWTAIKNGRPEQQMGRDVLRLLPRDDRRL